MAVHPGHNIAFTALLERINRCCEHSKEYLSKRNGSQPRKFSFDLAFKNTRINTHRLERSWWVWYSKFATHNMNEFTNHTLVLRMKFNFTSTVIKQFSQLHQKIDKYLFIIKKYMFCIALLFPNIDDYNKWTNDFKLQL
jgi:hypothetical protein